MRADPREERRGGGRREDEDERTQLSRGDRGGGGSPTRRALIRGSRARAESASRRNRIAPVAAGSASVSWPHAGGDPLRRRARRAGLARRLQRGVAARGVHDRRGSLVQAERPRSPRRRRPARRIACRLRADRRRPAPGRTCPPIVTVLAEHRRQVSAPRLPLALRGRESTGSTRSRFLPWTTTRRASRSRRAGVLEERRELGVVSSSTGMEPPDSSRPRGSRSSAGPTGPSSPEGYEVSLEAFPDIPGFEDDELESFEGLARARHAGLGRPPEATFVALAGDDVVGYANFALTAAQPTMRSTTSRASSAPGGRGVARALKTA